MKKNTVNVSTKAEDPSLPGDPVLQNAVAAAGQWSPGGLKLLLVSKRLVQRLPAVVKSGPDDNLGMGRKGGRAEMRFLLVDSVKSKRFRH